MTDEELMGWMIEGGWIDSRKCPPGPNAVVEWSRLGGVGPIKVTDMPSRVDSLDYVYWRHPRPVDEPKPPRDPLAGWRAWLARIEAAEGVTEADVTGGAPVSRPKPNYARIIHAWHVPSGPLYVLDERGRVWALVGGGWMEIASYPPGCDPRG